MSKARLPATSSAQSPQDVSPAVRPPDVRIGMIGLDISHTVLIAALLNDPANQQHVGGGRIVCGYPGGSPDMKLSWGRVGKFSAELSEKYAVALVDSIAEVVARSDAIMIMSVDGRVHLRQAREVFGCGKPVFMDKPLAASLRDAVAIARLAQSTGTPFFSSSSFRFTAGLRRLCDPAAGPILGAALYGGAINEPLMPDLFYEGIHSVEVLYAMLGPGCESVSCIRNDDTDVVTARWPGARIGTVYGLRRNATLFGATVFRQDAVLSDDTYCKEGFRPQTEHIISFFHTRQPPVSLAETVEIIAFLEAANESARRKGDPVRVRDLLCSLDFPLGTTPTS
jgi:hypothetical protein